MRVSSQRRAHGALTLIALTQWSTAQMRDRLRREIYLLRHPEWARLPMDSAVRAGLREDYAFADSAVAMYGWVPLIGPLLRASDEWTGKRRMAAQREAAQILDALVELHRKPESALWINYPALKRLDRSVPHRFVLPTKLASPRIPKGHEPPSWGTWQPEIHTLRQLLGWATADAIMTGAFRHLGKCRQCGAYYYSGRATRHQFCSDHCRDLYHRGTALERVRRHRRKSKEYKMAQQEAGQRRVRSALQL